MKCEHNECIICIWLYFSMDTSIFKNITQKDIDNQNVTTTLTFNMFRVYLTLGENDGYRFIRDRYLNHWNKNKSYIDIHYKLKSIWSNNIVGTFIGRLDEIIKSSSSLNIDEMLEICLDHLKDLFKENDNKFAKIDPHCNTNDQQHIFYYLTGKTFVQFIDELIADQEAKNIFRCMVEDMVNNKKVTSSNHYSQIYQKINNYNESYSRFMNFTASYYSYCVPEKIMFSSNDKNEEFVINRILGIGSYGFVIQYTNQDGASICSKIYFTSNEDKDILNQINQYQELDNIVIKSLYIDKYAKVMNNNISNIKYQDNLKERNLHFLIMECGVPIHKIITENEKDEKFIIRLILSIFEKVNRLYKCGIYFTDLKLLNILYSPDHQDVRFVDMDSFYYLQRGSRAVFSFLDLVKFLIPTKNRKIYITSNNLFLIEKVIILKMSILILELYGHNVNEMKNNLFSWKWCECVDDKFLKYIELDEGRQLKCMNSESRDDIPMINTIYKIFDNINQQIIK